MVRLWLGLAGVGSVLVKCVVACVPDMSWHMFDMCVVDFDTITPHGPHTPCISALASAAGRQ